MDNPFKFDHRLAADSECLRRHRRQQRGPPSAGLVVSARPADTSTRLRVPAGPALQVPGTYTREPARTTPGTSTGGRMTLFLVACGLLILWFLIDAPDEF